MPKYDKHDIAPVINADTDPATATVTPDVTTLFIKQAVSCMLQKVEIELPNGEVKKLEPNGDNSYSYQVEPGGVYTFVAYYSPLAVVYHLNASKVDGKVAQQGDMLGNLDGGIPKPTYDVSTIDADTGAFNAFRAGRKPSRHLARAMSLAGGHPYGGGFYRGQGPHGAVPGLPSQPGYRSIEHRLKSRESCSCPRSRPN